MIPITDNEGQKFSAGMHENCAYREYISLVVSFICFYILSFQQSKDATPSPSFGILDIMCHLWTPKTKVTKPL